MYLNLLPFMSHHSKPHSDPLFFPFLGARNLEVLYHARGVEIERLKKEKDDLVSKLSTEIRNLKHENTILKGTIHKLRKQFFGNFGHFLHHFIQNNERVK